MSSLLLLAVFSLPSHHGGAVVGPCYGHGMVSHFVPKPGGCLGYVPAGCCGVIAPHLLSGPPAPTVSPGEERVWEDYVRELDAQDREGLMSVWAQSDLDGRRKLLGQVGQVRAEVARKEAEGKKADGKKGEKKPDEPPISQEEEKKWATYLTTLSGEELGNAKKAWAAADEAGKRRLLKLLDK
ncbi:MAG: hypothetical protein ACRC33_00165 [Gemmataceae bacterium]